MILETLLALMLGSTTIDAREHGVVAGETSSRSDMASGNFLSPRVAVEGAAWRPFSESIPFTWPHAVVIAAPVQTVQAPNVLRPSVSDTMKFGTPTMNNFVPAARTFAPGEGMGRFNASSATYSDGYLDDAGFPVAGIGLTADEIPPPRKAKLTAARAADLVENNKYTQKLRQEVARSGTRMDVGIAISGLLRAASDKTGILRLMFYWYVHEHAMAWAAERGASEPGAKEICPGRIDLYSTWNGDDKLGTVVLPDFAPVPILEVGRRHSHRVLVISKGNDRTGGFVGWMSARTSCPYITDLDEDLRPGGAEERDATS